MKEQMYIYAAAILAVSALIGRGTNAGAAATAAQTKVPKKEASKAETAKKGTTKTLGASEEAGDTVLEEIQVAAGKHHVKINIKDYGTVSAELYGNEAPIMVANFLKLAEDGFYDGLTFHHIISGFMIRDGDPSGTGMGGSDQEIKGEFLNDRVENPLSHARGAISMARSQIRDNANSQFFIVYEDSTFLDGDYACSGYVTEGVEIVSAICEDARVEDSNGSVIKANQPIIESIEVVD